MSHSSISAFGHHFHSTLPGAFTVSPQGEVSSWNAEKSEQRCWGYERLKRRESSDPGRAGPGRTPLLSQRHLFLLSSWPLLPSDHCTRPQMAAMVPGITFSLRDGVGGCRVRKSFSEDFWAPLGIPRPASEKDDLVSDGPTTIYSLELGEGSLPSLLPVWCPVLENTSHLLVVDESHPAWKGAAAGTPAPTPFPLLALSAAHLCRSQTYLSHQWPLTPPECGS